MVEWRRSWQHESMVEIATKDGRKIATVHGSMFDPRCEMEANANLVAAAPLMLAALKRCHSIFEQEEYRDEILEVISDAITQAETCAKEINVTFPKD